MTDSLAQATLTNRAILAAGEALAGRRRGLGSLLPFAGPAVMASVAYMDPGNFATNIQAGAKYNYDLLWVVLAANIIAMLFQALSAKLGIVTGRNLAELSRERFPRALVWAMWVVSEIGAMATDLAEFLGGAIGLSLLFGMPLLVGMVITGIATYAILSEAGMHIDRVRHDCGTDYADREQNRVTIIEPRHDRVKRDCRPLWRGNEQLDEIARADHAYQNADQ